MNYFKLLFLIILFNQLLSFIVSLLIPEKNEKALSNYSFLSVLFNNIVFLGIFILWIVGGMPAIDFNLLTLYHFHQYAFSINGFLDIVTIVFLLVGNLITMLILYFSRYYMHRESGFKRFFNTILFFHIAYTITTMAGNFITMFIGWEFLGVSSFLLVAFYRERYLPVRNAVKIFSVYRIGDVGFILGIWAINQIVRANINFSVLALKEFVDYHFENIQYVQVLISLFFLMAAIVKSAQFPFTYWIARAMEGPTPSSAIFYGSLSVNMGILLLFRTYSVWEDIWSTRIIFGIIGLVTVITGNSSAKVQSSIKAKVAYSSATQVGFMFIELALGLKYLVLLHFASNAFLRTYQLLVSPSVASYLMQQQVYFSKKIQISDKSFIPFFSSLNNAIYILAQKEWNLDYFITKYIFGTLKYIGKKLKFIHTGTLLFVIIPLIVLGIILQALHIEIQFVREEIIPLLYAMMGLILIIRGYAERYHVFLSLFSIVLSQVCVLIAISFNEQYPFVAAVLYLSGIVIGLLICTFILFKLYLRERRYFDLNKYYGHIYQYRWEGFIFLIGILCMIGFPVTPAFIGEDIILEHIHLHQFLLTFFIAMIFILSGIQGIRIYTRLFLGPHCKNYHEVALKSA